MEFERFKEIILEVLEATANDPDVEITPETSFVDDLDADSLDFAEIIMAVEDELDISIDDESLKNADIKTVQDALDLINASI